MADLREKMLLKEIKEADYDEEGVVDVLHYYQNEFSDDEDLPLNIDMLYEENVDFIV